ncbi:mannose-6-phosphate isomerase [Spirochaetia bacterium]|nr:mannose-6-phosphate isomerase [Spirochaetia bacterium]
MVFFEKRNLIPLIPNRVRRNYRGGAGIDRLQGRDGAADSDQPEDWVASLVAAKNPGLPPVDHEGFSRCALNAHGSVARPFLIDVIRSDPEFYLGGEYYRKHGVDLGFLLKILDSGMRLHTQVHPTAAFAQEYLASPYGKLECYYILEARPGTSPYIRLGFQHLPSREEWKRIILEQDIAAMDRCFEKVPVRPGEVWYIPGGVPHAIGENIMMLEIMEPSDLVVRCEFEREGIIVPPEARFMGKDIDFCLDIFHYEEKSVEEITAAYRINPTLMGESFAFKHEQLVGSELSPGFRVERITVEPSSKFHLERSENTRAGGGLPAVALVTRGGVQFTAGNEKEILKSGDSIFIAAGADWTGIENKGTAAAELCLVLPAE